MRCFFCLLALFIMPLMAEIKIGIIGDSNSVVAIGFRSMLPELLKKEGYEIEWINASVSASTTQTALKRLKAMLKETKPDILILTLGINDFDFGYSLDLIEENLIKVVELALDKNIEVMLGSVDVYNRPLGRGLLEFPEAYHFKEVFTSLGSRYSITVFPFLTYQLLNNPKYNIGDFLHPNEEGHKIITQVIYQSLKPILAKINATQKSKDARNLAEQ